MNRKMIQRTFVMVMGLVIPAAGVFAAARMLPPEKPEPPAMQEQTQATEKGRSRVPEIPVLDENGNRKSKRLDDYLTGVLLAEMPAEFSEEALKAQSVVSATYALRRVKTRDKHDGAVCLRPGCCQGYRLPEDYIAQGGSMEDVEKVRKAVSAVSGQVLTYDGELIEATFFSCTGGSTEAAVAVWGSDVPYLQATPSPGEEIAVHYEDETTFSKAELESSLSVTLPENSADWFDNMTFTEGGGVASAEVGGVSFTGVELRKMLGLRSTDFSVSPRDGEVLITTHGFGHRVGMSQYGAQAMALEGKTYDQILAHYYQGTELADWDD